MLVVLLAYQTWPEAGSFLLVSDKRKVVVSQIKFSSDISLKVEFPLRLFFTGKIVNQKVKTKASVCKHVNLYVNSNS